jgi:hypothetical protein
VIDAMLWVLMPAVLRGGSCQRRNSARGRRSTTATTDGAKKVCGNTYAKRSGASGDAPDPRLETLVSL